jgi:uncharacterized membrane protein YphA (DoxX/SURF4 family)
MAHQQQPNSCPEWAYAHLILRLWVGCRLLFAGLDKMREKGGEKSFGFQWIGKSMEPIVTTMSDNVGPWMPSFSIKMYALILPYALLIGGVWVILGFANRIGLLFGGLIFVSLSVGLMSMPDDTEAVYRGIEVAITALALMTAAHNTFTLDGLLGRGSKKGCCAHKE